jgi:Helix-turn-helix domain of resolvase
MKWVVKVVQEEIFKTIELEGREIEVSNFGTVRCENLKLKKSNNLWVRRSDELPTYRGRTNYLYINVGRKKFLAHLLVAQLFIEKPKDDKHYLVWFIDRNNKNIKANNLIWISREECNMRMSLDYAGRTINNDGSIKLQFEQVQELRAKYEEGTPVMQLAKKYKVSHTQIKRIVRRENFVDI